MANNTKEHIAATNSKAIAILRDRQEITATELAEALDLANANPVLKRIQKEVSIRARKVRGKHGLTILYSLTSFMGPYKETAIKERPQFLLGQVFKRVICK